MFRRPTQSNDDKIIAAMDAVDKSVRGLRQFAARYNKYIDEAALRGDDARAKQLILQKVRVCKLAEQLETLKTNIELGAFTAHSIAELKNLPPAIAGCKGLLAETPDFTKLGKSITSIFKDISKSEDELAKLNDILNPKPTPSISSRLNSATENEDEVPAQFASQYNAEYADMMDRLKGTTPPVESPNISNNTASSTGEINYAGIIAEENKKK